MSGIFRAVLLSIGIASCHSSELSSGGGNRRPTSVNLPAEPNPAASPSPVASPTPVTECSKSSPLPTTVASMKEVFNWRATGTYASFTQVMVNPVVGPLSGTGSSIVFPAFAASSQGDCGNHVTYTTGGAHLFALSAAGSQQWVSQALVVPSLSAALGDIDGDGKNEALALGLDGKMLAFNGDGSVKWVASDKAWQSETTVSLGAGGPAIADFDGDGKPEVLANELILNGTDGSTKTRLVGYKATIASNYYQSSFPYDIDLDGKLEVITPIGVFKSDGSSRCAFPKPIGFMAAAKLRPNDSFATIVGTAWTADAAGFRAESSKMIAYNGTNCEQVFSVDLPGGGGGPINIADVDGDGILEFGTAGSKFYALYQADGSLKWRATTEDFSSGATGSTAFDFNGDGKVEIVYNDENHLRVFDGQTGTVLYQIANSTGTLFEYPVVADLTGDGHAKIIVGANNCFAGTNKSAAGLRVFSAPNNNWVATRSIWNQFAYFGTNVSDSGSVVGVKTSDVWKYSANTAHAVGFRNNPPYPKAGEEGCR